MGAGLVAAADRVGPAVIERGRRLGAVAGVEVGVARDIGDGRRNVGRSRGNVDRVVGLLMIGQGD